MKNLKYILLFAITCLFCNQAFSQDVKDTSFLRKSIEQYPDSLGLHKAYTDNYYKEVWSGLDSTQKANVTAADILKPLILQYNEWIKIHPNSYIIPFAIGDLLCNAELPGAKSYLQKTVDINPKYAPAWMDLSTDAERWGDFKKGQEYMAKAADAEPNNLDYAFYCIDLSNVDLTKTRNDIFALIKKFPNSERGAQALYWLGVRSANDSIKTAAFKNLKELYPPNKFDWSENGMEEYFDFLLTKYNWNEALSLSEYMNSLDSLGDAKDVWKNNKILSAKLIDIDKLLKDKKGDSANAIAKNLEVKKWHGSYETIKLLKAETIAATGNTVAAYDSIVTYFAKAPQELLLEKLLFYGKALGKKQDVINKDVWKKRNELSKTPKPFTLAEYMQNDSLSLSSLKGKIVLLTFWFPGCGPCRGEFPHFESVLKNFEKDSIVYIGINVEPAQDQYVIPFMRQSGYSFIPLHANWQWALKNYNVQGAPENFLIDQSGKIVYSDFTIRDKASENNLKMMINSLLDKNKLD